MTTLITLVLPIGGDAGPFNLSSNVGGYTPPFETNVSASALQAGYTTSAVPDGTTIIRVTSVGVCTNSIDITVGLTPTTTTTSSSSTSTTTSSSSTSTSTSSSTTTSVPTTTTTTTCACLYGTVTIDQVDIDASDDGTVYVQYQDCDGHGFCDPETPCVGGVPYTVAGVYPNDICILNTSTPNCPISIYIITGGLCNISEGGSTVTLGGCCTEFTTTTTTTVAPTTTTTTTEAPPVECNCQTVTWVNPGTPTWTGITNFKYRNCEGVLTDGSTNELGPNNVCAQDGSIVITPAPDGDGSATYDLADVPCCSTITTTTTATPVVGTCTQYSVDITTACETTPGLASIAFINCSGNPATLELPVAGLEQPFCALAGEGILPPFITCGGGESFNILGPCPE